MWRVTSWKLYKIKTKDKGIIPFIPNKHQMLFYEYKQKYPLIVLPKARQLWYSTAEQIWMFDEVLFRKNFVAWVIADKQDTSLAIFRDKIMIARDNLPPRLKSAYKVQTDRANELSFTNESVNSNSRISVSTWYRWGTLQALHISEFGKICAERPQAAREIVEWALQSVAKWQSVVIESTAKGSDWPFYDFAMWAKSIQDEWREPNEMEYKLLFVPRHAEEWYRLEGNIMLPPDLVQYFKMLEEEHDIHLTQEQKNWYYMKKSTLNDAMLREYPSFFEECFQYAVEWAYYMKDVTLARQQQRICNINPSPHLKVHTAWDLWWSWWWDDTVVWFFQVYNWNIYFIDYRDGTWYAWLDVLEIVKNRQYNFGRFIWPHDIEHNFTWESRRQMAKNVWVQFDTLQSASITDGIQYVRSLFHKMYFDKTKCERWIKHLENYRRKRDNTNGTRYDKPEHNGASHAADALRYACMWLNNLYKKTWVSKKIEW